MNAKSLLLCSLATVVVVGCVVVSEKPADTAPPPPAAAAPAPATATATATGSARKRPGLKAAPPVGTVAPDAGGR